MSEEEIIEQVKEELKRVHKINHLSGTYVPIDYLEIMLNLNLNMTMQKCGIQKKV